MWGTADFLGGVASRRLPAAAVYGWSQAVGCLLLIAIATLTGSWGAPPGYWPWAIAASAAGIVGMIAFYRALAIGPMGIVSPLVAGLLWGETPSGLQIIGILAAVIGVLLASGPELSGAESARPLVYAGVALVGFGFMFIAMERGSQISAVMTMTGMRLTTIAVFAIVLIVVRRTGGVRWSDMPGLAALGVLDAGANVLFGIATTLALFTVTSVLGSLYPVVTCVLAALVLKERLRPVQYVGVGFALVGVVLLSLG